MRKCSSLPTNSHDHLSFYNYIIFILSCFMILHYILVIETTYQTYCFFWKLSLFISTWSHVMVSPINVNESTVTFQSEVVKNERMRVPFLFSLSVFFRLQARWFQGDPKTILKMVEPHKGRWPGTLNHCMKQKPHPTPLIKQWHELKINFYYIKPLRY